MSSVDRYEHYLRVLGDRDLALVVLLGLVVSWSVWYWILAERPRRWYGWGSVGLYLVVLVLFLIGGNPDV